MNNGPAKWTPPPHIMMPGPPIGPEERAYDRGVAEGIRWERDNQLRDMAKAAMTGLLLDWRLVAIERSILGLQAREDRQAPEELAAEAFFIATAMLAESERRATCRQSVDDSTGVTK